MAFSSLFTFLAQTTAGQGAAEAAPAAAAAGQGGGLTSMLVPLAAFFFIFYFLIIRPQSKKNKEHQNMLSSLKKGDKIYTSGGISGIITGYDEREFTIEIAPKVRVKVLRSHISNKIGPNVPPNAADDRKAEEKKKDQ